MKTTQDWQFDTNDTPVSKTRAMTIVTILFYLSISNLVLIATALLARLYLHTPGFLTFRIMLFAIIIGIIIGILTLAISSIMGFTKTPILWNPVIGALISGFAPAIIAILITGIDAIGKPLIHDISTDVDDPPEYREVINLRSPEDNSPRYDKDETATKQLQAYPEIKPIISKLSVKDALTESTQVIKDLQWEFINLDYENGIIEAYDTSTLFGFIDDIIIRVHPVDSGSRIDIRSSSRVGKGDLGKNAERILSFINTFRS